MQFLDGFWWRNLEGGRQWGFLFDGSRTRVFGVVKALVLIMLGSYQMTVGASVERTVLPEMSKMVALSAESFSSMFGWGFLEGFLEGECI